MPIRLLVIWLILEQLSVRASASIRKYAKNNADPITTAKELDVEYLVTGSYFEENDLIHLTIEFINVNTNELLWRDTIRSEKHALFNLQNQLSQLLLAQLKEHKQLPHSDHAKSRVPSSALAYEFYLRGLAYPITVEGAKLAAAMLEKKLRA